MFLQRILLIPSLLPLAVVLVLSALHRGEPTRLHLLGWSSPEAPLGVWTALAATGSAALATSSALLLVPARQPLRRRLHRTYEPPAPFGSQADGADQHSPIPAPPQRDLRDPAPTVAVTYRIIKRGGAHEMPRHSADPAPVQSVGNPGPRTVSVPLSAEASGNEASDWGDDPNRDW
jgi:hypothetical protein